MPTRREKRRAKKQRAKRQEERARRRQRKANRKANREERGLSTETGERGRDTRSLQKDIRAGERLGRELSPEVFDDATFGRVDQERSSEIADVIARRRALADSAGQTPAMVQRILDLQEAALGGLTAEENTALRERSAQGLDRQFANQQRALAATQGATGVRGAAAGAQLRDLARDRLGAQQALERDILLENIAIQDQRRNALLDASSRQGELDFNRNFNATTGLEGSLTGARADELARQQFNINQGLRQAAARTEARGGGTGLLEALRGRRESSRLFDEALDIQRQAIAAGVPGNFGGIGGGLAPVQLPSFASLDPDRVGPQTNTTAPPPGVPSHGPAGPSVGLPSNSLGDAVNKNASSRRRVRLGFA